jgi:IS5 family transposase
MRICQLPGLTPQPGFSQAEFADEKQITRRGKFLTRPEALIPWAIPLAVIEPFYPKGERGRSGNTPSIS